MSERGDRRWAYCQLRGGKGRKWRSYLSYKKWTRRADSQGVKREQKDLGRYGYLYNTQKCIKETGENVREKGREKKGGEGREVHVPSKVERKSLWREKKKKCWLL